MKPEPAYTIRGFRPSDRAAVRRLCCQTGFLGTPIDPVYEDHELFADFLTTYYTDHEPESSFVLEIDGELKGYLLGSRKPLLNQLYSFQQNIVLFLRSLLRYPRYNARSRRFIRWMMMNGWREVPAAPARTPHFHINLLPEARKISTTRALMSAYLSYLYRCGEKRVYGQIVTFESRRGEKMFERYGFRVMNRAEITKYRAFYPESVYLSTVIKNLETAEPLSAYADAPTRLSRRRCVPAAELRATGPASKPFPGSATSTRFDEAQVSGRDFGVAREGELAEAPSPAPLA